MCRKLVFFFLAFSLASFSLVAQASPSPVEPSAGSTPTFPQPSATTATPLSPSASPASLPPEFWTTWAALALGLQQQIEQQERLAQSATASQALSQSESASTASIGMSLSQASQALGQTSTAISSATDSSAATSAAVGQATAAAVLTQSDLERARIDAKALGLKLGILGGAGVTLALGGTAFAVYEAGKGWGWWR